MASGLAELTLGGALIALPRYRAAESWIAAAFFVAIFPGNISQYVNRIDAFGLNSDRVCALRLLFQFLLVASALWRPEPSRRGARAATTQHINGDTDRR